MKTIEQFQKESQFCIDGESMTSIKGGRLPELGETVRREDICTGGNDGDCDVAYYTDSGSLISVDGSLPDGTIYHQDFP